MKGTSGTIGFDIRALLQRVHASIGAIEPAASTASDDGTQMPSSSWTMSNADT
jgi:hypothetical protein